MKKDISSLSKKRREKRQKTGWSEAEIKAALVRERELYKKQQLSEKEPDDLVSGDMTKIHEELDEDDEKK
ncbi:MAG TPA: hypothetical protein ENK04_08605 [Gammaproteobacteria bacterium]|nr:hypothetical protein [Gammaproteobacteria bacterium]